MKFVYAAAISMLVLSASSYTMFDTDTAITDLFPEFDYFFKPSTAPRKNLQKFMTSKFKMLTKFFVQKKAHPLVPSQQIRNVRDYE